MDITEILRYIYNILRNSTALKMTACADLLTVDPLLVAAVLVALDHLELAAVGEVEAEVVGHELLAHRVRPHLSMQHKRNESNNTIKSNHYASSHKHAAMLQCKTGNLIIIKIPVL